ncbi:glycine--tRNA ligase subunit beta [Sphingomonas sp. Leaf17]|uniref:glycine--tRNA ligase subunit beta n=1 Tax=Sphingomonas sp. Leaf17 TaxID=1735683 RepID=UPI0006FECF05|nr:glycine--tRNA ligase subunit beta [Sphingomonas sp. Leaf17]KQM63819.1 glycine--tRNA ligase subunit beta [Sphingomonas sp. Leaf17]
MTDFLLELRSEEIPARMQAKAREDLARLFTTELAKAGLTAGAITTYASPRRLALIAHDLPEQTQAVSEEVKGPKASAPPQALDGFLRKTGLTREQLTERDGVFFAVTQKPGRATADVIAAAIPSIIRAFPWPKAMRWGDASTSTESLRWVRPLQGIVAILGTTPVAIEIAGIVSGTTTAGHRFHHDGPVTLTDAASYVERLRAAHVIVDQNERARLIRTRAGELAAEAGLTLVEDEGLVAENAGLTEWPVPLLGRFDPDFLSVPPEVIQLTARVNQKYFVCRDAGGALANAFVCTANIAATDGGAKIVEGNRKVLAARLSDARFFYDTDLKIPLEEQAEKLSKIVFHEKLGTVADKVDRVAKLARWLVEEGIVGGSSPSSATTDHPGEDRGGAGDAERADLATLAERAARLAKADLVTGMVGEFPELQGLMGGYYAAAQGEDPRVAAAIRDHYKPVGQGDDVPTDPVTVAVSLADKLDTLFSFFSVELYPTGSKDPFALRRAMLGVIATVLKSGVRCPFTKIARIQYKLSDGPLAWFLDFLDERLKVQQREAGVRHDLIDAVFALGGEDDLVRLLARVHALQAFVTTEDGRNLLAGYKRAANILKKSPAATTSEDAQKPLSYTPENAEAALMTALDSAEPRARAAIASEDFAGAMAALASLRAPIDAFFDDVTVNDPDDAKRTHRLALLARVRDAVHSVADFSKIEG